VDYEKIKPADALPLFKARKITVLVATPINGTRATVVDPNKQRAVPLFDVKREPLAVEHILSAKKWDDGSISVTTIDGQRYQTPEKVLREKDDDE